MRCGCSGITQFGVVKDLRFDLLGNSAVEVIIRCTAKNDKSAKHCLRLQVCADANQLLLGVFCLDIHQANVPLNQQLMSQMHTVCSFTMGHFTAPTGKKKWKKMMREKKKYREIDWKESERERVRWYLYSPIADATGENGNPQTVIFIVHASLNNNFSVYSCWRCHNVSCNITSAAWATVQWKTNALTTKKMLTEEQQQTKLLLSALKNNPKFGEIYLFGLFLRVR